MTGPYRNCLRSTVFSSMQTGRWKKTLSDRASELFETGSSVWSTDITYIPLRQGYMVLAAVMDWHSRYVLSWEVSNSLDSEFCVRALEDTLRSMILDCFQQLLEINQRFLCYSEVMSLTSSADIPVA